LEVVAGLHPGLDRGVRGRRVVGGRGGLGFLSLLGHPPGPVPLLGELLGGQRARSSAPAPWGRRITGRADRDPLPRDSAELPLPYSSAVDVLGWILVHACTDASGEERARTDSTSRITATTVAAAPVRRSTTSPSAGPSDAAR